MAPSISKKVFHEAYEPSQSVIRQESGRDWVMYNGDSAEVLRGLPESSIAQAQFSIPFMALYTYSDTPRDLGNCESMEKFLDHYEFIAIELLRVLWTGRLCCVHIQDVVSTQATDGIRGIKDFTGPVCELMQAIGFTYSGKIPIDKNPQMQAARNKVHELMFATKNRDAVNLMPVMLEYVMVFRKPGSNQKPVIAPIDNETWIDWAHGIWPADGRPRNRKAKNPEFPYSEEYESRVLPWYDIRETDVLNTRVAKDKHDERHMCPLQLGVIERLIKLWTNEGETVLDPFAGIGSAGFEALRLGRKFVGIELKPSYFDVAVRNLRDVNANRPLDLMQMEEATDG